MEDSLEDITPAPVPEAKESPSFGHTPKPVTQPELDAYCASQSRTSYSVMELSAEDQVAILARRG